MFESIGEKQEKWLAEYSALVDCWNAALSDEVTIEVVVR